MTILLIQFFSLLLVGIVAVALVLTRAPGKQTIGLSFYGILLGLMMFAFQAPDVALAQIVVGAVALPLMILLGLAEVRRHERKQKTDRGKAA